MKAGARAAGSGVAGLLSVLVLGCSSTGDFKVPNDRLIVPGTRIGPVSLGMSDEALFKVGTPDRTREAGNWIVYNYGSMRVFVDQRTRKVVSVGTGRDSAYRTAGGVKVGSTMRDVQAALGPPSSIK